MKSNIQPELRKTKRVHATPRSPWQRPIRWGASLILLGIIGYGIYSFAWQAWAEHRYRAAQRALEEAVSRQPKDHLEQARAQLTLCLKVRPDSLDANFLAARTCRRMQAYDDASSYLRHYQKLDGVAEAVRLEQALADVQRGNFGTESYLWACVQKDHPDKLLILEALTRGYMLTYQIPRAVDCLNRWLEVQPACLQALLWRGQVLRLLAHYDQAVADYEQALQLDPECGEARLNLAEILIHEHKSAEAARHFEILADREPGNVAAILGLGRCKAELGNPEGARQLFDRLVGLGPEDAMVLVESGKLLLNNGQLADAEARLRAALRLAPNEREALYSMYKCLEQRGRKDEAAHYLQEYNRVEKDLDALKSLMQQIMQKPDDAALRCEAARIYLRNGLLKEAKLWLEDALRADRRHGETYALLADYYDRIGKPDLAAQYRQRAKQLGSAPQT
jgi:tetratricopeptide (TPR) repeat protein